MSKKDTQFTKDNQPINRPPRGKDRKWATLEYWFQELLKDLNDSTLPITERAKIKLKMVELILGKKSLPADTPEESVANTSKLLEELQAIESLRAKSNTDKTGSLEIGSK
jgi:hypothetical protein